MKTKHDKFSIKYITRKERWYRNYTAALGSFLIAFAAASMFAPVHNSDAAQLINVENEKTGYYVRVNASAEVDISVDATPGGQLVGAVDTVTTTTNSPRGYQLYISSSPNYLYLNGDASTTSSGKFSPIGGGLTSATTLGRNTWGFAFDKTAAGVSSNNFSDVSAYETENSKYPASTAVYASLPTTDTMIQQIAKANLDTNGTKLNIYYGVNASTDLLSGSYQGSVTYTAISEGVNVNADTMQDFTTAECNNMTAATSDNYDSVKKELIDVRDGKWYTVAKMKDGNCWMTQNLALDGMDSTGAVRTLTPDDSNVTQNRTLAANATTFQSDQVMIYSIPDNNPQAPEEWGNLYSWTAATAGVGNSATPFNHTVYESVCPKGWRLPGNNYTDSKSYASLSSAYGVQYASGNGVVNVDAVRILQAAPLNFATSGVFNSTYDRSGETGYYWERVTYGSDNYAYGLNFATEDASSDAGLYANDTVFHRDRGLSVRCVFEGSTIENNMFMQDINLTMCDNLAESTASSDNRRTVIDGRDNKTYKISKLADGNCWMVQNLALDGGRTLQPTDSNVTESATLPANTGNSFIDVYDAPMISSSGATTTDSYNSPYGNLYNWNAATAGAGKKETSGTVTTSICPKGWRLPDRSGTKSFANLMGKSGLSETNTNNATYVTKVQQTPLYFPLAGLTHSTSRSNAGYKAYYTTRGVPYAGASSILLFFADTGDFYPDNSLDISYGTPVRCLLGE